MGVSVYWPQSVLCVFVCVMSDQSTSKKPHYMSQTTVNLTPCCIKHIPRSFWHIKCGAITHSAKESRHEKKQWVWGLEATGKGGLDKI